MQIPALSGVMRSSGAEYLGINKSGEIAILKVKDASGHEHKANGQFGSGGSSAAKPKGKESAGAKHKRNQQARRAEGAGQSTLSGGKAIQSLLSGGSALDKLGIGGKPREQKEPEETTPEKKPEKPVDKKPENVLEHKPATTISEAETFAKDNIIDPKSVKHANDWNSGEIAHTTPDKVQQIKLISYRGVDIQVANVINKQLIENVNFGLPRPTRIIATQMRKTPNTLMAMGSSGSLKINTTAVGNFKKIDASLEAGRKLNGSVGKDLMKTLEKHAATMTPVQKQTYEDIKEIVKYSRACVGYEPDSNPERGLQSTVNHEVAHMLPKMGKYGYDTPQHEEFLGAIREMAKITVESDYKYKLSSYGCHGKYRSRTPDGSFGEPHADHNETFAELYSAYRFHEDDNIHPDALKLLKKYLPER